MKEPNGILIYGELTPDYKVKPVVKELLTKARELKPKLWNQRVYVCVIGPRICYDEIIKELETYGADGIVIVSDDRYKEYNSAKFAYAFKETARIYPPRIILFGATVQGKEIASYSATKFETGLTADCSDLDVSEDGYLLSTRPTFGGKLYAQIICKTYPQCATVREHNFTAKENPIYAHVVFNWINPDEAENKVEKISSRQKGKKFRDVRDAKIIVSGGAGACKENGFSLIYLLAQKLGAAVGGSREAFEKGYITKEKQIGQTGHYVAPDLYIAVGISGADQHLTAIKNSKKIIAINSDENAPIFKSADVAIVGDLFKILPEIIDKLDEEDKEDQNE